MPAPALLLAQRRLSAEELVTRVREANRRWYAHHPTQPPRVTEQDYQQAIHRIERVLSDITE